MVYLLCESTRYHKRTRLPRVVNDSPQTSANRLGTAEGLVIGGLPLFHSRRIFPMRVTRRMVPSKRTATAIWKLGLLRILSFLPIRFKVREYWVIMTNKGDGSHHQQKAPDIPWCLRPHDDFHWRMHKQSIPECA